MQSLAAYSFEATVPDTELRLQQIDSLIDDWLLTNKGADDPHAANGNFESLTGDGTGAFERKKFTAKRGVATEVVLLETAHTGATFTTTIQVACAGDTVSVFVSLSATPGSSLVAPIKLYPRCPAVVRKIIEKFNDWRFAGQDLPFGQAFDATQAQGVKDLCNAIRSSSRRLPLIVVSIDRDEQVWHDLHTRTAEHLVGLADVAFVDADSSWSLTDELGPRDSCYLGAVRLYWPLRRADGSYEGVTWVAQRLAALGIDDQGRNRFLSVLRRMVMSTAALTMLQPNIFREIQNAATKERLQALEGRARDAELDSIIDENAKLSKELEESKATISTLQWKLAAISYSRQENHVASDDDVENSGLETSIRKSPEPGETRYYKKIGSGGGVDTLVQTNACQHNSGNWKPAFKGDQAEKGLLKLEGRDDWQSLAHCSACTGGGRWRVHW
ncbi:hypothetical protein [Ralstonia solanacearum]|uniref:hypothetical protein n=1 Tax=Ralstonia solanacearum TaxID=305 RepID=UPI0018D1EF69|nr:hypothetical protein [Ralstonia solanacearum]